MRFFHLIALALFSALVVYSAAFAAQKQSFKIYAARDGLAGDYITAITFEPNGSAWIGTSEGATHISDAGWVSYTRAHGLGDSWITAIAIAPDGKIWFGTQSGGVSVLEPVSKTITTYNLDNSDIPSNFVTALAIDAENRVWVGTLNQGIARYNVAQNEWTHFNFPEREITTIALDFDSAPWVGTTNGVFHFDGANWIQEKNVGDANVRRIDAFDGEWYLTTDDARYILQNDSWVANDRTDEIADALNAANLAEGQITAFGKDYQSRYWFGTPRGIFMVHRGNAPNPPTPIPAVLVHGWTVAGDDTLETSEFRFLKSYADRDGIPMYYARGVSPKNTLFQNAALIRDEIARVKKETGADKVNLIGFSMGGMNTRAYLESSLYANDVNRAIILGTPQAGVEIWKPILYQQILQKPDEPSALELSPEYAQQIVNQTRAPNPNVMYDLLIGDARQQAGLDFLNDMPASDALISVDSALALNAPNVNKHVNADLHDWGPEAVPLDLTSYLYPRATWERYLRNTLRNNDNAPIGSEIAPAPLPETQTPTSNHTPVVTEKIRAGETVTRTVLLDENKSARFLAYYPNGKIDFSLVAPDGKKYEPSALPRDEDGVLSLSTDIASFSGYVVKNAPVGEWKMILTRADAGDKTIDASTYVELDAPLHLQVFSNLTERWVGEPKTIHANVNLNALAPSEPPRNVQVRARIAQPSAEPGGAYTFSEIELYDDGKHDDNAAGDGNFANTFVLVRAGWHLAFVQAQGKTFAREQEVAFAIAARDAKLTSQATVETRGDEILIQASAETNRAGEFAVRAEIKRENSDEVVARAFVPLKLDAGVQDISIPIAAREIPSGKYNVYLRLYNLDWAAYGLDAAARVATFTR